MTMDARQVRDTVEASHFPTVEARDQWLARAFGQKRRHLDAAVLHAQSASKLCPLDGEVYLYLAETSFLALSAVRKKPPWWTRH